MSPGIELATSRTEGRALANCAILGLNYLQSLSVFSNAKFSCPDDHSFARKESKRRGWETHDYIQTRHKDLFSHYKLILRKL